MTTGYTAAIHDDSGQTFPEFAMDCARAFGALIELRDSPHAEIPDEFEPHDRYAKAADQAKQDLARWQTMTDAEVEADLAAARDEATRCRAALIQGARELETRYRAMLAEVEAWTPPTSEHVRLKEFMVEQLTASIDFDCSTRYLSEFPDVDPSEWRASNIEKYEREVGEYEDLHAAEVASAAGRSKWVRDLRASLEVTK